MTETPNWATPPPSEEELAEITAERGEAAAEVARQEAEAGHPVEIPGEEGELPEIDRRSAAERFAPDPEVGEAKDEPAVETEASEEKEKEAKDEAAEEDWWEKMSPEDKRKHALGLQSEISKIRESRREDREESERRFKQMMEAVPEQISKSIKESQPPLAEPDSDEDPEAFKEYHASKSAEAEKSAQGAVEAAQVQRERADLLEWMGGQEANDPDFKAYFDHLFNSSVDRKVEQGRSKTVATTETWQILMDAGKQLMTEGGNWAKAVKYNAVQAGWKADGEKESEKKHEKSSGEETAATISAGEKTSKALGRGGSGVIGKLTQEDIYNIKDPEEFDKAYKAYIDEQLEHSTNWQ